MEGGNREVGWEGCDREAGWEGGVDDSEVDSQATSTLLMRHGEARV